MGKRNRWFSRGLFAFLLMVFLIFPATSFASLVLDFGTGQAGNGGLITLTSDGNATGTNIPVAVLTYTNVPSTPAGGVVYDLSGPGVKDSAVINFSTGGAEGNFFQVIGHVDSLGISTDTTLASGTFSTFQIIGPSGNFLSVFGSGADQKSKDLLNALGLDPNLTFTFFGFSLSAFYNSATQSGIANSTDFSNTAVPVPAAAWLLGTGLIGLVIIRRRMKK